MAHYVCTVCEYLYDEEKKGEAWSQLSGEGRAELTRPLRVESGRASPPGVGCNRREDWFLSYHWLRAFYNVRTPRLPAGLQPTRYST